jgi:hypothetical protein
MSDNDNWCNPDSLPEELILSDKELSKMICIIIANVELKRDMIRKYQELLEKLEVDRNKQIEGYSSPEALVRTLLKEQLGKNKNENVVETFTDKEIEDIRNTLDKIKNATNKNTKKEKNNNNK